MRIQTKTYQPDLKIVAKINVNPELKIKPFPSHEVTLTPELIFRYSSQQERSNRKSEKIIQGLRKLLKKIYNESSKSKGKIVCLENHIRRLQEELNNAQNQLCQNCKHPIPEENLIAEVTCDLDKILLK
jgi:hypothetical protein